MEPFRIRVERGNRIILPDRIMEIMGWKTGSLIDVDATPDGSLLLRSKPARDHKVVLLHPVRRTP